MTMPIEAPHDKTTKTGIEGAGLVRLLTWMSPAFPLGAFSYSHGLETAISDGRIIDRATALKWLTTLLTHGGGWSDAVFMSLSWHATDLKGLLEINDHALAMAPSKERFIETSQQGAAFLAASRAWPTNLHQALDAMAVKTIALPVIMGAMAREHDIEKAVILQAGLHAFAANLTSAAMRLVPLGQSDGLAIQAALEPTILKSATKAADSQLADIGTFCLQSDIAAMQHETLKTRIFRS